MEHVSVDYIAIEKNLQTNAIIRLAVLLGPEVAGWVFSKLHAKYKEYTQPPNYYWNIKRFVEENWDKDFRLKALRKSKNATLIQPNESAQCEMRSFTENQEIALSALQTSCASVFKGQKSFKNNCRMQQASGN